MNSATERHLIKKRCVFYLSGFDPRGGRHYYSLYKNEAKLRPEGCASVIDVGRRITDQDNLSWVVTSTPIHSKLLPDQNKNTPHSIDSANTANTTGNANTTYTTRTEFKFMAWDKIIRKHWTTGRLKSWLEFARTTPTFVVSGALKKGWSLGKPATGLLIFPNILIILTLVAMMLSALLTFKICSWAGINHWLAAAMSLAPPWGLWRWAHWFEASRDLGWTMRSYAFTARQSKGQVPELEARLNEFAQHLIAQVKKNEDDEILVIGHSSGAVMAVSVMARALQQYPELMNHKAELGLVTLGQCLPMLGVLPEAITFRTELKTLSYAKGLLWVDISSPSDRCCVAMLNPYISCGVEPAPEGQGSQFLAVNPLFHELFAEQSYSDLKKNAFQMHFQYLKAPPSVGDYDYFEISAGSLSLKDRFERRILSPLPKDFESQTYLKLNPDLKLNAQQATHHYQQHGARENRPYRLEIPEDFDAAKYLLLNPDVAAAGIDAEIHYVQHGRFEKRSYK